MRFLCKAVRRYPRTANAAAFGVVTMVVTHLMWLSRARTSGLAPVLTVGAGLMHALAAGIAGPCLLDGIRTRSMSRAAMIGACTSLLAQALSAPIFAAFLFATELHPASPFSYFALPFFIGVFGFFAAGWALLLVSIGVACALYQIANS
jgi:hypothetical protein